MKLHVNLLLRIFDLFEPWSPPRLPRWWCNNTKQVWYRLIESPDPWSLVVLVPRRKTSVRFKDDWRFWPLSRDFLFVHLCPFLLTTCKFCPCLLSNKSERQDWWSQLACVLCSSILHCHGRIRKVRAIHRGNLMGPKVYFSIILRELLWGRKVKRQLLTSLG